LETIMSSKITMIVVAAAMAISGCAASTAQQPRASSSAVANVCSGLPDTSATVSELYASGGIYGAEPIYRREFLARAIQPRRIAGATFRVPAEPTTNAAHLERVMTCHALAGSGDAHPSDPLRVAGVENVGVVRDGPAYRVKIVGRDHHAGAEIWRRARTVVGDDVRVEVEQVAAVEGDDTAF
jgi:hypothetical protein